MFIYWILFWTILFIIFFLVMHRLKRKKKSWGKDCLKSVIGGLSISIPFTYLSFFTFGNWPLILSIIYVTISISWPLFGIYTWGTGKSKLEQYSLLTTLFLTSLIILATSDDFERWFALGRLPGKLVPLLSFILLILGIYGWILGKRNTFRDE
ncbi:hypothetical protein [Desulfolucanica intricata]|uniref:hypothetical protein n=1 Tax=Desulfolucanica intricata TaxID=1285191 RepID=UPI000836A545|nr:hypothetical protein [Desulfolucanica intricata]